MRAYRAFLEIFDPTIRAWDLDSGGGLGNFEISRFLVNSGPVCVSYP